MAELHCKMGKLLRARLIKNSQTLKVTTKKKRGDGSWMVYCPQCLRNLIACCQVHFKVQRGLQSSLARHDFHPKRKKYTRTPKPNPEGSMSFQSLRTGGKALKSTQVYPEAYGKKICELHSTITVFLACFNLF